MNPGYHDTEFHFPPVKSIEWSAIFGTKVDSNAIVLISKLLMFDPNRRLKPLNALAQPYFD
jgi:hypothetical protein